MYLKATEILNNFVHYEISNFAISDKYKSRHNLTYWQNKEYYGFGCSAHGYENNIRYANALNINNYIENPLIRDFGHTETNSEKLQEEIFLGLRISDGINIKNINMKFNIDFDKKYSKVIEKYISSGHLIKTKEGYKLSNEGFLISTVILAEFL